MPTIVIVWAGMFLIWLEALQVPAPSARSREGDGDARLAALALPVKGS